MILFSDYQGKVLVFLLFASYLPNAYLTEESKYEE